MSKEIELYPIRIEGDPVLRTKCEEVTKDYVGLDYVIERMHATLDSTETGVGLAAPQVGLPIRLFILGGLDRPKKVFINPEILVMKGSKPKDTEGCLSIPKVFARVERSQKVKLKYFDENFVEHTTMFKGFEARVIQHEFDHLEGIEFYDRIPKEALSKIQRQIDEIRKGNVSSSLPYKIYYHETHKQAHKETK